MTFEVQVKPANNFPIDLYLLMDLSASMSDDLQNLKRLGTQLGRFIYTALLYNHCDQCRVNFGPHYSELGPATPDQSLALLYSIGSAAM